MLNTVEHPPVIGSSTFGTTPQMGLFAGAVKHAMFYAAGNLHIWDTPRNWHLHIAWSVSGSTGPIWFGNSPFGSPPEMGHFSLERRSMLYFVGKLHIWDTPKMWHLHIARSVIGSTGPIWFGNSSFGTPRKMGHSSLERQSMLFCAVRTPPWDTLQMWPLHIAKSVNGCLHRAYMIWEIPIWCASRNGTLFAGMAKYAMFCAVGTLHIWATP